MRVTPPIKATGEFWLPAAPDRKVTGTLSIEDGASIRLEFVGMLWDFAQTLTFDGEIPQLCGVIEGARSALLEGCYFESRGLAFGGPAKSRLYVSRAFLSGPHGGVPVPAFTRCTFRCEGFEEWHRVSGLRWQYNQGKEAVEAELKNPADIPVWSDEATKFALKFSTGMGPAQMPREITLRQDSCLELSFSVAQPLDGIAIFINQLQQFVSFGIDATVSITDLHGYSPETEVKLKNGGTAHHPVSIYFGALLHGEKQPAVVSRHMFFRWDDIKHRAHAAIEAWRSAHTRLGPALNLYFSARTDPYRYLNVRFMFLIQALETFHRRSSAETLMPEDDFTALKQSIKDHVPKAAWEYLAGRLAYGNEPGLGKRIQWLVDPFSRYFGDAEAQKRFVQSAVDTRNFYTHFDPRLEKRAADGNELIGLCDALEALFQLQLARVVGFSDLEIDGLVSRHPHLRHKLPTRNTRSSAVAKETPPKDDSTTAGRSGET